MAALSSGHEGSTALPLAPRLVTDLAWSLQPWPVTVSLGPIEATIEPLPAAAWVAALLTDPLDAEDIFPGLASGDVAGLVDEALFDETITVEQLDELVLEIVSTVAARPWYVAVRIIAVAKQIWDTHGLGGRLVTEGVDASRLSLSAWLDAVLYVLAQMVAPKDLAMFYAHLEMPPTGMATTPEPEEMEMSRDAFMSLMAS